MIEYYEMKAMDRRGLENQENEEEEKESLVRRDRSDSLRKNILKYEKHKKNLDDSREHDFEGFDLD